MDNEFNDSGFAGEVVTRSTTSDKSKVAAALLCFFLGGLGIHRFYLGHIGSGAAILILSVVGWLTVGFIIGVIPLGVIGIWWIIDFIRILCNSLVDKDGRRLR